MSFAINVVTWRLFTYYVSQKWGGPAPPSPPCQPKTRNWLTFPPPLVRKKSEIDKT